MKKNISLIALLMTMAPSSIYAAGYMTPQQSLNSTAKSAANVAHSSSADTAYYNPANMSFLPDRPLFEVDLTYIHLPSLTYKDSGTSTNDGKSEKQNFLRPTMFYISPDFKDWRFGFSVTFPAGLAREWKTPYQAASAEEFHLTVVEANPVLSYKVNDKLSLAAGLRALYSEAKVKSNGLISNDFGGITASRDLEGDATAYGYNLAVTARPISNLKVAATYRSKIILDLNGDGRLWTSAAFAGPDSYNGSGTVSVPVPAVLSLASSYSFDGLTAEIVYERTFWNAYDQLDFNYPTSLGNPYLIAAFDNALPRNWSNSDAWRVGVSYEADENWDLMAGFVYAKNPVPDSTLGFGQPDADSKSYSLGVGYRFDDDIRFGIAYLYSEKEERSVINSRVNGSFSDGGAHILTVGCFWQF